jgi:hypothetical protein
MLLSIDSGHTSDAIERLAPLNACRSSKCAGTSGDRSYAVTVCHWDVAGDSGSLHHMRSIVVICHVVG